VPHPQTLYHSIVNITEDYLGPAAQRFVDRQLHNHVGKQVETLTKRDIAEFIEWSRIALGVLTDNTSLIEEYIRRLQKLT
jgi:hypothetical protein